MFARRFTRTALAATIAAATLGSVLTVGAATANATPQDDYFLEIVKQLNIPTPNPDDAIQVAHQICDSVEAGQIEPARTVRGIISKLRSEGLDKGQATHLVWGAVDVYCPQYRSLVGR